MKYAFGMVVLLAVLAALIAGSLRHGIGRLPVDIVVQRENFSSYLPISRAILVSIALSLAFWIFGR